MGNIHAEVETEITIKMINNQKSVNAFLGLLANKEFNEKVLKASPAKKLHLLKIAKMVHEASNMIIPLIFDIWEEHAVDKHLDVTKERREYRPTDLVKSEVIDGKLTIVVDNRKSFEDAMKQFMETGKLDKKFFKPILNYTECSMFTVDELIALEPWIDFKEVEQAV